MSKVNVFSCDYCSRFFNRKSNKIEHQNQVHLKIKRLKECEYCKKQLDAKSMWRHMKLHKKPKTFNKNFEITFNPDKTITTKVVNINGLSFIIQPCESTEAGEQITFSIENIEEDSTANEQKESDYDSDNIITKDLMLSSAIE